MKGYIFSIIAFMFLLISYTHANLEYKGYERIHGCTGECYEEYVALNGTPADIERAKQELCNYRRVQFYQRSMGRLCDGHGQNGEGVGAFPRLAGQSSEYIIDRLTTYKNRGNVGAMSSTMWLQAGMLSEQEIDTIGKFIGET